MAEEQAFIYEPYYGYDSDDDRAAADNLRALVELLEANAAQARHARALAASVLRNAQSYEALRPQGEESRAAVRQVIDELLAGYDDLAYLEETKRQGRIAVYQPPPPPPHMGDPDSVEETKRQG